MENNKYKEISWQEAKDIILKRGGSPYGEGLRWELYDNGNLKGWDVQYDQLYCANHCWEEYSVWWGPDGSSWTEFIGG